MFSEFCSWLSNFGGRKEGLANTSLCRPGSIINHLFSPFPAPDLTWHRSRTLSKFQWLWDLDQFIEEPSRDVDHPADVYYTYLSKFQRSPIFNLIQISILSKCQSSSKFQVCYQNFNLRNFNDLIQILNESYQNFNDLILISKFTFKISYDIFTWKQKFRIIFSSSEHFRK